ncbi:MAG: protein kinase [Motiliproteus sp.]|nr:protein kinase [Motiliproteus sp.]MCW9053943.1 protein kinase [Motiliproteus sp.]
MDYPNLQQFYIPEEQSIYLLSHGDAQKLKDWVSLCKQQLQQLGYQQIELIGKGAFGFVFGGIARDGRALVFKFSRINLPQHVQDRLEEEAFMLGQVDHPQVPKLVEFQRIGRQAIMVMERAPGVDLEEWSLREGRISPRLVTHIAAQLAEILSRLRYQAISDQRPVVHGDIKPSNVMFESNSETVALIDWGSSVYAQLDAGGQFVSNQVMDLMSGDLQNSNARLGDVYFIGSEQLNGALSSPRFDEQGLAGTLYALASGQSCRFGFQAIPATALGLPIEFARVLQAMLEGDQKQRGEAGDYFLRNMANMAKNLVIDLQEAPEPHLIPIWSHQNRQEIETVAYSSRKSFLREEGVEGVEESIKDIDDVQFDRYYKNFLQGMGETEKAFLASISRLGKYPVVGGLAVRWQKDGVYIDSCLNLHDDQLRPSFVSSVNNMVSLARAIYRQGVFKCCFFNAKDTLHIEREDSSIPFVPAPDMQIPFEVSDVPEQEDQSRVHSYFEDGKDPEEFLELPGSIIAHLQQLNEIHHAGLIIFESLPTHLKIHSYYRLLDPTREADFRCLLEAILEDVDHIRGSGISGFMKMPYKDTRVFTHIDRLPERFYPRDPKRVQKHPPK